MAGKPNPKKATTPPPPPPPPPPPVPEPTPAAFATLKAILTRYGLLSLYDTAVEWMRSGIADSPERLELALRDTPQFQERFQGIFEREANGLPPISVDAYLSYENQAYQLMRSYGFPLGFYDQPDDFAQLIGGNVSTVELEQRLAGYAEVATLGRETVRQELSRHAQEAGVDVAVDAMTDGDLAAWFADPDRGLQAIRARVRGAQSSAAAVQAGFGALSAAEGLAVGSVLEEGQARQAFTELARQRELFDRQVGERDELGREVAVGAITGDAEDQQAIERRAGQRVGQFRRGGEFSSGREGFSGIGAS